LSGQGSEFQSFNISSHVAALAIAISIVIREPNQQAPRFYRTRNINTNRGPPMEGKEEIHSLRKAHCGYKYPISRSREFPGSGEIFSQFREGSSSTSLWRISRKEYL
jgi:hypothetical protein